MEIVIFNKITTGIFLIREIINKCLDIILEEIRIFLEIFRIMEMILMTMALRFMMNQCILLKETPKILPITLFLLIPIIVIVECKKKIILTEIILELKIFLNNYF
jgi:hypothetical protein